MMKYMRLVCLVLFCACLCGCTSAQVEDQAYVLVMGLDRTEDGKIEMTVQIPQISGSSGESGGGSDQNNYKHFSILANNYEEALEKLNWAATREPDLAQMKLIVLSSKLASEQNCKELIENIAQTERLYTATKLAVCEGKAGEFVAAMHPNIGTRISSDIDALFEHYCAAGYVPPSSLADLYYQTESIYSDPMVAYALLDDNQRKETSQQKGGAVQTAAMQGSPWKLSADYKSDNPVRYLGAAVFQNGQLKGILNGQQTIIANLMQNHIETMHYEFDGQSLMLVPTRAVRLRVDTDSEPCRIIVDVQLSIAAQEEKPDEKKLRAKLENEIRATIEAARSMQVEPFGFAEKAAKHFWTFEDWQNYNWRDQFKTADIEVKLKLAYSDT